NHQGQFPSITITYNLKPEAGIEQAAASIRETIADLHLPDTIHPEPAGDINAFAQTVGAQPILILAALIAVYIVLGVLYESLAHPLTILSTLPSSPLARAIGRGSERRRPLGITIIGGLLVSQALTLYTTPVIYLLLDRLHRRLWGSREGSIGKGPGPRASGLGLRAAGEGAAE